ncbi:Ig-like domain (group 2) [Treponema bryantii]|uniref:Ig-like domain (Group 2) n=1 Tax=Treponema bryantii TaxID=163 RepID=A0A1I3KLB5_9SPIR|nr:family 16 glycosylhydrolase [Treponema bryantii]SFI73293.1 Ig-like domain (group 2) [Treponema bryantii]
MKKFKLLFTLIFASLLISFTNISCDISWTTTDEINSENNDNPNNGNNDDPKTEPSDTEVVVTSLSISGASEITVGGTITLTANVTPSTAIVTWSSNNTKIATVSNEGIVTGVKTGNVTITAKAGKKSKSKTITVTAASSSEEGVITDDSASPVASSSTNPTSNPAVPATRKTVTIPDNALIIFDSEKGIDKIDNRSTWGNATLTNVTVDGKTVKKYELGTGDARAFVGNLTQTFDFPRSSIIYLSVYANNNFKFAYHPGEGGDISQTVKWPGSWDWYSVFKIMTGETSMSSIAFSSESNQIFYIDHIYIIPAGEEPEAWNDETASAGAEPKKAIGTPLNITGLEDYTLVWADDFTDAERDSDGTPLSSNWGYDIGRGQSNNSDGTNPNNWAWGNGETQWYSDNDKDNTWVSNGTLKIRAIKETGPDNNATHTSGRIVTRNVPGRQWEHGYIEMRAKIPVERGVWPAFWMLDNDIYNGQGWPLSGEIDIMESSTSIWGVDKVYGTLHCEAGSGGNPIYTAGTVLDDIAGEWHTYAVKWDENSITWYYDGEPAYWTLGKNAYDSDATYTPSNNSKSAWPYDESFYIIINLAVGGNLGGTIGNWTESTMTIDYVRVYQK